MGFGQVGVEDIHAHTEVGLIEVVGHIPANLKSSGSVYNVDIQNSVCTYTSVPQMLQRLITCCNNITDMNSSSDMTHLAILPPLLHNSMEEGQGVD